VKTLFFLSLILSFYPANPASAGNCDCGQTDALANGGCGPKPANLPEGNPFSEVACKGSSLLPDYILESLDSMANRTGEALSSNFSPKSNKKLLNYLSCYRDNDEQFCHMKNSVAPYLSYAASTAHFPLAVETCLLMKESLFDPKAKSEDGALGYAQLMPGALKEIEKVFQNSDADWGKELERVKKERDEIKNSKLDAQKKSQGMKMKETTYLLYKARRKTRKIWDDFWAGTQENPCAYGKSLVNPKETDKNKRCLRTEMANCYRYAPLLSMMKQTLDATSIAIEFLEDDYDLDTKNDSDSFREVTRVNGSLRVNGMSEMDSALFLAGAYNCGAPGFASRCGSKTSMRACIESFPKTHQTREHMQGIRNCAQNGSEAPTQNPYDPKSRRSDCEKKRCYP